jgi:two-component system, chemotaxis family, chemotaxis protein CheY
VTDIPKPPASEQELASGPDAKTILPNTVLVVEDSKPFSAVSNNMFKQFGFNVLQFPNGQEAKDHILAVPEIELLNVQLIFSDYMMPKLDGLELLKFVRGHKLLESVPFVMSTAVANSELVKEAKKHKVTGFFVKPIQFKRLTEFLKEKSLIAS